MSLAKRQYELADTVELYIDVDGNFHIEHIPEGIQVSVRDYDTAKVIIDDEGLTALRQTYDNVHKDEYGDWYIERGNV